jgi:hypothetical protein
MKERGKAPEPDDRANAKEKCDKPGSGEKACEPETKPAPPAKP